MNRFLWGAVALVILFSVSGHAADTVAPAGPPKLDDMFKLETYEQPEEMSNITLSRAGNSLEELKDFKGKIIVLNVWATWCPPCLKELPSLNALQTALGTEDVKVLTISMDTGDSAENVAQKYMQDNRLTALDPYIDAYSELTKAPALKDVPGIPVTLILDKRLRVVARYQGDADWNGKAARAVIDYYVKNTEDYSPIDDVIMRR